MRRQILQSSHLWLVKRNDSSGYLRKNRLALNRDLSKTIRFAANPRVVPQERHSENPDSPYNAPSARNHP